MSARTGQQHKKSNVVKRGIISLTVATFTVIFVMISAPPVQAASVSSFFDHSRHNGFFEDQDSKKGHDFWDTNSKGHDFWDQDSKNSQGFGVSNSPSAVPLAAPSAVPLPGAVWLFGSGLMGLLGMALRSRRTVGST